MGSAKLLVFIQAVLFVAQVSSRAVNITTSWSLPQEAFPHFFRYFKQQSAWSDAKKVCETFQGELLTVETEERKDAARAYLKELDVLNKVWIGLKRSNTDAPFVWTGGGNEPEVGDGFWQEPPSVEPPTLCVSINPLFDFRWQAMSCSEPEALPFICQLPVPIWAKDCLVNSLPSLTVTYLLEHRVIELLSDCGLSGTKRIACRGGENESDLIKRLSCDREEDVRNATAFWTGTSRSHHWDTSTPSDWSNSITSQMTRSSGTRHKRESRGTSAATDSSLISTSDTSWEQDPRFMNKTEINNLQEEAKNPLEGTTVTAEETNEDQIEESRGESIDQLDGLQTSVIESEDHQSEIAVVATEAEPPTVTSNESQSKSDATTTELKLSESTTHQNENTTQVFEFDQLDSNDPNIISVIALEGQNLEEQKNAKIVEMTEEEIKIQPRLEVAIKITTLLPEEEKTEKVAVIEASTNTDDARSNVALNLDTTATPDDRIVGKAIERPPTSEVQIPSKDKQQEQLREVAIIAIPTGESEVEDLLDKDEVVIVDAESSNFKLAQVESSFGLGALEGNAETTGLPEEHNAASENLPDLPEFTFVQTALPQLGKDSVTLQKYQISSKMNKLEGKEDKILGKLNKSPGRLHNNGEIDHSTSDFAEIYEQGSQKDVTTAPDTPIIVIAEMQEVDGKEGEDVEHIHPFTSIDEDVISTETPATNATKNSLNPVVDGMEDEKADLLQVAVNSKQIDAVQATGRPLVDIIKNDSVEGKAKSNQQEPSTEVPRSSATNEPKDTVSDSTTRVQTMSTPTQGEPLSADESNDELEAHKRPNRGRLYTHSANGYHQDIRSVYVYVLMIAIG